MLGFSKITTPFRLFYRMTSTLSKPTSRMYSIYGNIVTLLTMYILVIIEQTNPLESNKNAIYSITTGTTSFHEFILNYPRGAYTGMRTLERNAIVEFDAHVKRLTNSLALLKWDHKDDHINQAMASFKDPIELKGKLVPLLKKGLESFYEQINTEHETKVSVMIAYSFQVSSFGMTSTLLKFIRVRSKNHALPLTLQGLILFFRIVSKCDSSIDRDQRLKLRIRGGYVNVRTWRKINQRM